MAAARKPKKTTPSANLTLKLPDPAAIGPFAETLARLASAANPEAK